MTPRPYGDLVAHLVRSTPLSDGEADRVVAEVVAWFAEPVAEFVRRRHRELAARPGRYRSMNELLLAR